MTRTIYQFRILGTVDITRSDDLPVPASVYQPKKVGLLLILLLSDSFVTRASLVGLLWPDVDEKRARRSLSQLLHALRNELGADLVVIRGEEEVGLNPEIVTCDVHALREAAACELWPAVVDLDVGELAPGFGLRGSATFEQWLDSQRRGLAHTAADAAWRAGVAAEGGRDLAAAERLFRRCMQHRPFDEVVLRRLMSSLAASGRGIAALSAFEEYRARAQRELDVTPAIETRRLAIDIAAALEKTDAVPANAVQKEAAVTIEQDAQVRRVAFGSPRAVRWAVAAGMIVIVAAVAMYGARSGAVHAESDVPAIVIATPLLEGGASAQDADFVRSLPALVSARLAADAPIRVVSGARAATQRGTLHLGGTVYSDGDGTRAEFVLRDDAGTVLRSFRQKLDVAAGWDHAADQVANTVRKELGAQRLAASRAMSGNQGRFTRHMLQAQVQADADAIDRSDEELALASRMLEKLPRSELRDPRMFYFMRRLSELGAWNAIQRGDNARADSILTAGISAVREVEARVEPADYNVALARLWHLKARFQTNSPAAWVDSARTRIDAAAYLSPQNASVWAMRSALAAERGDYVTALSDATRALRLDPYLESRSDILVRLFSSAFNLGRDSLAAGYCADISSEMPRKAVAASCRFQLEAWSEVRLPREDLSASLNLDESPQMRAHVMPVLQMQLAAALARRGDVKRATGIIRQTVVPDGAMDAIYFRAVALHLLGREDEARRDYMAVQGTRMGRLLSAHNPRISRALQAK